MSLLRSASMRSSLTHLRAAALRTQRSTPASARQRLQMASRRGYASHGDGHASQSLASDMPWLIGAVGVTVPAAYLILSKGPLTGGEKLPGDEWHGESSHDDGEEGGDEESEDGGEEKEEGGDEGEEKAEAESGDKSEDKSDGDSEDKGGDEGESKEEGEDKSEDDKPADADDSDKKASHEERKQGKPESKKA